jgi:hypothetical protein
VRNLAAFNGVVILLLVGYAYCLQLPLARHNTHGQQTELTPAAQGTM